MPLLNSQKNELFDIIEKEELPTALFNYLDEPGDGQLTNITTIAYKNSDFYFKVNFSTSVIRRFVTFSPGFYDFTDQDAYEGYNDVRYFFIKWLTYLKREIGIVDKWEQLQHIVDTTPVTAVQSGTQFTYQEVIEISQKMDLLKERIASLPLTQEQGDKIIMQLDHLTEIAKTANKTDWANIFIGAIVSSIMSMAINAENAGLLWTAIKQVFSNYILPQ